MQRICLKSQSRGERSNDNTINSRHYNISYFFNFFVAGGNEVAPILSDLALFRTGVFAVIFTAVETTAFFFSALLGVAF